MSSSKPPAAPPVSMTKRTGARAAATPAVKPPRSVDLLGVAMAVTAAASVVRALVLFGYRSELYHWLIANNAKASAKTKKAHYVGDVVYKDLHSFRTGSLVQGLLTAGVILVLAYMIRRTRVATGARWATLIVLVLFQIPLYVLPTVATGLPAPYRIATFLMGLCGLATLLLLFVPSSSAYFRACRAATVPAGAAARPGGFSLFGPRRPVGAATRAPQPPPAAADPEATEETPATATPRAPSRAKAKVRSDAEAVARGAELARTRAKAGKPRRTGG